MNSGEQPSFGRWLRDLREEAGLTQEALALARSRDLAPARASDDREPSGVERAGDR